MGWICFYSQVLDNDYGSENFKVTLGSIPESNNNVYTLDLSERTLTEGKLKLRTAALVGVRVAMTLILEALIFWLFAFRKKESWIAFLLINLMTQIALNVWITGFPINLGYY
ncbi:MAG: hypothetical protein IBX70_08865 [Clostridia bacterium]|nr:hypothetical protein [Clostridia bacterium]